MKKKLSIIFLLIFFLLSIFNLYKNYWNEILLAFIDECQIEKINYIPENSTLIVGHAYGSPDSNNNFISNKIKNLIIQNKFKEVIFTGDVLKLPSEKKWEELNDLFYKNKTNFYIAPGNHDVGIGENDKLLNIYKKSQIKPKKFPHKIKTNDFLIIIENTSSNPWKLSEETLDLIFNKNYNKNLLILTHHIIVKDLLKFTNSKQGMPKELYSFNKFKNYNFTIISGDSGAFETLPRIGCFQKNEFYYIFNGIGDISNDTVIILNKGKILSYEIN